jgi:hypothetical protein
VAYPVAYLRLLDSEAKVGLAEVATIVLELNVARDRERTRLSWAEPSRAGQMDD